MNNQKPYNTPYKVLATLGSNKIVYCYECKTYHIHYESLSFDLTLKGLFLLMEEMEFRILENSGIYPDDKRWIEITTSSDNIRFYFSVDDCRDLAHMIVLCIKSIRDQPRSSRWN